MNAETIKDLLANATPGPWITSPTDDTVVIAMDRSEVAAIYGDYNQPETWPIMESNARLIALTPQLAADNIALQAEVERLREALDGLVRFSTYVELQIGNCEEVDPNDFMAFCLYLEHARSVLNET